MTVSSYSGVRVAVLGASGFIGRWVARALTRESASLILVVRDGRSMERLAGEYGIRGEIVEVDVLERRAAASLIERVRPAITFNLVGYGVDPAERDEGVMQKVNAELVSAVIDAVAEGVDSNWNAQALVHAGSALEYGPTQAELSENSPTNPVDLYGASKLEGTRSLTRRAAERGVRALTARLFTVYGPGEHSGRLLPSLIEAAKKGSSVSLTEGRQARDFSYVEDIAEGLLRLGVSDATAGEVVNVASGKLTPVRDFALMAARVLEMPEDHLEFGGKPVRDNEMWHGRVKIDRLRQLTGWAPSTEIPEGIRRAVGFTPRTHKTVEHPDAA